eukprot:s5_g44.t1
MILVAARSSQDVKCPTEKQHLTWPNWLGNSHLVKTFAGKTGTHTKKHTTHINAMQLSEHEVKINTVKIQNMFQRVDSESTESTKTGFVSKRTPFRRAIWSKS